MSRLPVVVLLILCLLPVRGRAEAPARLDIDQAVSIALSSHERIEQAKERLAAARAEARAAKAERLFRIDAAYSYDRLDERPFERFNGLSFTVNDEDLVHYQLSLTQPLFTGFALSARQKLAAIGADLAAWDLEAARRKLAFDVRAAAIELLLARADRRLAAEQRQQFDRHLQDARALNAQGMIAGNDVLKAEVALAAAEQQLATAESRVLVARSRLNLLLGRPRQAAIDLIEPSLPAGDGELDSLIDEALAKRPELHAATLALEAARQKLRLAGSAFYPELALVAGYWRDGDNLNASRNIYRNNENSAIGLRLQWNLFAGGADRARLNAERHRLQEKRQALKELRDMIGLQVEQALRRLQTARQNRETAEKALQQARENHRMSVLQFRENLISISDLIEARTTLTRAESNLQAARYGQLLAAAQLDYALGRQPARSR
ncbi:outer membrane protein TolC [Geothermobacter ehrlichii]|uniref:Outer membrane protein TolC n=1 Tax=Geothermobacter ehrlichii TaxID=213224 RepID=A0A5D3WLI1_9BACT|nr:TolC family protein [Geothermobacter ehrlichii]TYP00006.1 outer membrane protein TolC [Geothermobacter ehrlichii]